MRCKAFPLKLKADDVTDTGRFAGYLATFGNVDQGGDVIAPGAFGKSLAKAKADDRLIPLLWQHKRDEPIGKWLEMREDEKGLYVEGKLHIEFDEVAKRAYGHLKQGTVGGASIGYHLVPGGYEVHPDYSPETDDPEILDNAPIWLLSELDLREGSIVTMPMNIEARLEAAKSIVAAGGMPTARQFEALMREACGFSKTRAAQLTKLATPMLQRREADVAPEPKGAISLLSEMVNLAREQRQ